MLEPEVAVPSILGCSYARTITQFVKTFLFSGLETKLSISDFVSQVWRRKIAFCFTSLEEKNCILFHSFGIKLQGSYEGMRVCRVEEHNY